MNKYNIEYFNIQYEIPPLEKINIVINEWKHYEKIFRLRGEIPKNKYQLIVVIVTMIRQITCRNIIKYKKIKINKIQYNCYCFNWNYIIEHLELCSYRGNFNFPKYIQKYYKNIEHNYIFDD
jgi:hypothetical protein